MMTVVLFAMLKGEYRVNVKLKIWSCERSRRSSKYELSVMHRQDLEQRGRLVLYTLIEPLPRV